MTVRYHITLPWPDKRLSPNARLHWTAKAKAKQGYKTACFWHLKEQKIGKIRGKKANVTITFHPPDNRKRDMDNMLASAKTAIDAVSQAVGIDDSKWDFQLVRGDPQPKQGAIVMELEA